METLTAHVKKAGEEGEKKQSPSLLAVATGPLVAATEVATAY